MECLPLLSSEKACPRCVCSIAGFGRALNCVLVQFRGWLDELLVSSWQACQHSDVIIESPSTMGGIHIAEALQVPYCELHFSPLCYGFGSEPIADRAFTMTWTRTRAYPHA